MIGQRFILRGSLGIAADGRNATIPEKLEGNPVAGNDF